MIDQPRGIRNNNPGNIEHRDTVEWKGEIYPQTTKLKNGAIEDRFCQFESPEFGLRAIARILGNYQRIHDRFSIRMMIHRWAPPVENDTDAYVSFVSNKVGIDPDKYFTFIEQPSYAIPMMQAIVTMENGEDPYTGDQYMKGYELAWSSRG